MLKIRLTLLLFLAGIYWSTAQSLADRLEKLAEANGFTYQSLETDTFFTEKYVLYFSQFLDHTNPEAGSFDQRVFLAHRDPDAPVVFITEGYTAGYAGHPRYINELTGLLKANQVCAEHRYYGESVPDSMDWQYLNVANAAADHHHIVEVLKKVYGSDWVSTGISKGGQTAMYHRTFYPDDVSATVGYVCPLNFSIEDQRVYRFLNEVGDETTRLKVVNFQEELLKNKSQYFPEFERMTKDMGLTYGMGVEKGYELTVLEYSFAYWQWGKEAAGDIPEPAEGPDAMIRHLHQVVGMKWISEQGIKSNQSFFYQALREIGFYGYDISAFRDWVSFDENPTFDFAAPANTRVVYDPAPMIMVDRFIRHEAENMIFIYGETDPWSSTAVDLTFNNNLIKVVKPGGSHTTRIGNLSKEQQDLVIKTLKSWLSSSE